MRKMRRRIIACLALVAAPENGEAAYLVQNHLLIVERCGRR